MKLSGIFWPILSNSSHKRGDFYKNCRFNFQNILASSMTVQSLKFHYHPIIGKFKKLSKIKILKFSVSDFLTPLKSYLLPPSKGVRALAQSFLWSCCLTLIISKVLLACHSMCVLLVQTEGNISSQSFCCKLSISISVFGQNMVVQNFHSRSPDP